jgi:Helix-turn-helix domain
MEMNVSGILSDYLTDDELSAAARERGLRATPRTLRMWRSRGEGPPYAKFGREVLYPRAEFAEWLGSRIKKPRPAPAA